MLTRQKIALKMITISGGRIGKLDLVKHLFLLSEESNPVRETGTFYQFLPYLYGPFSFALYNELNGLERSGTIAFDGNELTITKKGLKASSTLEKDQAAEVEKTWDRYGGMTTDQLVEHVYKNYPWYTVNSDKEGKRRQKIPKAEIGIYMAGYEGMQIDGFLNLLLKRGIKILIDVRGNPYSRKYGFSKETLERLCKDVSLEYKQYPQLGVPSDWRADLDSDSDYIKLFNRYRNEVLHEQKDAINEVAIILMEKPSVVVCRELLPSHCHRASLAEEVKMRIGLPVKDLRFY